MSSPSSPARGRPARLDRARTLQTALDLLDQSGLDALTMRRLADAMGVQAGALYRYFATKQDLLTAMAERMMEGAAEAAATTSAATADGGDWSERLTALARAARSALLAHRDGARVFAGTHATGESVLGFADAFVGVLRKAGFGDDAAARALYTVVNYTVGHTLEEQAALQAQDGDQEGAGALRDAVSVGTYPHLSATLPALTSTDFTGLFEFGLDLIVGGLRARHAPPPTGK
ncbi:TetR/AcrR family transcriptional regulator [Streptomyces monomycini]|uniref:TetR/AcrR family transcriptional regulator n=1 Tax=Streptomyces monomycini TaxID=371720 RepID=UPI0004AB059C|nr:TetR/AcrR family transcriptional regulator [Streptomyces monomycini]